MEWWVWVMIALWVILGTGMNVWTFRNFFQNLDIVVCDVCCSFVISFFWPLTIVVFTLCRVVEIFYNSDFGNMVVFKRKDNANN